MQKTADTLVLSLDELIIQGQQLERRPRFVVDHQTADAQYWLSKAVAIIRKITFLDTYFYDEAIGIVRGSKRQGGISSLEIDQMVGHLMLLRDAIKSGLLEKIEYEVSANDFQSFIDHAEHYCQSGKKMEASVIASAVLEDTLKKLTKKHGVEKTSGLEGSINGLKSLGVFSAIEAKKLKYYAGIRNSALHASWDEFELENVRELINGVRQMIASHITS